jgi:uncharacterized membrane protein
MIDLARLFRHLTMPHWAVRRAFPRRAGDAVEQAVRAVEKAHDIELRVAIEGGLPLAALLTGHSARERAIELFSQLRVWDTAANTGVLLYVQFADRKIEIVADRGIAAQVSQAEWDAVCARIAAEFGARRFEAGALAGIAAIAELLKGRVLPPPAGDRDELPDRPTLL